MKTIPSEKQFSGCLIGQCLGDALGFPVEGRSASVCVRYVKEFLMKARAGETGRGHYSFGQYTDDSQLARELVISIVSQSRFDPADYARRIANIFSEGKIVARGMATSEAAARLARGVPWDKAGTPPPSAGNGSAMRAAPIGLMFHDDNDALVNAARDQGIITHKDTRCSAGAVAIAGAVALALEGPPKDTKKFLDILAGWAGRLDESVADAVYNLKEWITLPPDEAAPVIAAAGQEPEFSGKYSGIPGFVTGSVLWSLYSFLRSPDDYWETICTAIITGGDVDTTAAMAGAISGACLGLDAIPLDLARRINDNGAWKFDDLINLSRRFYELKTARHR